MVTVINKKNMLKTGHNTLLFFFNVTNIFVYPINKALYAVSVAASHNSVSTFVTKSLINLTSHPSLHKAEKQPRPTEHCSSGFIGHYLFQRVGDKSQPGHKLYEAAPYSSYEIIL